MQTLLNTSQKNELSAIVDIELTSQEDNVQTLAYAQSTDQWATALAGINSSQAEQKTGKNEHLRSFLLEYPPKRKRATEASEDTQEIPTQHDSGKTKALGRAALFSPSSAAEKLTYQRVLRLSKKREVNGPRMGVVATGLAPEGEIVVFAADTSRPGKDEIRARLNLGEKIEAADVDIVDLGPDEKRGDGNFRVAYCTDYDVYCTDVNYAYNRPGGIEPQNIYGTGHDYALAGEGPRPKFRCLRLLTPTLVLVLQNLPKQGGSEVFVIELTGAILARKRLHGKIKSATGLSVATLPYPQNYDRVQHAIAVAGADRSITILTLDHPGSSPYGRKLTFRNYAFMPNVHDNSIMSLTFSEHIPPNHPYVSAPTQCLKVATTSMVNTCVVHTMVLGPYPVPTSKEDRPAYLLNSPTRQSMTQNTFSVLIAIIAIAIGSFFLQAFTEIRGGAPEYLGAKNWLNPAVHDWIARPYMFEDGIRSAWSRSISSEVENASSQISSVTETPSSILSAAGSSATSAASSAASSGSSVVSEAASPAVKHASKGASKISSAATSIASSASSKASEGTSMLSSTTSEEVSGASSVLSEAALSASHAGSSVASSGSSYAGDAASAAASNAKAMAASASRAASSASSIAATDAGAEKLASSASEVAASASSLASSAASEAATSASSSASKGASSGSSAGTSYSSAASSGASSAATAVSSGAASGSDKVGNIADAAQETLGLRALLAARDSGADRREDSSSKPNRPHEIIVRHSDEESALSVETHPPEKVVAEEMEAKRWEDLDHKEKAGWKKRCVAVAFS